MNVIVIGGGPAGTVIDIPRDVRVIELRNEQPAIVVSPGDNPVKVQRFIYEIHEITLLNTGEKKPNLFGIAVLQGQTLVWAMQQLMTSYQRECHVLKTTQRVH